MWTNRWFDCVCWAMTAGAGAFAAVAVFDRLYGVEWPLGRIALVLAGAALLAAAIWAHVTRASRDVAAATLDDAAGLRERVSTGLYCQEDEVTRDDPFAQAVVADAERVSQSLSARQHVRLRAPFSLAYTGASVVVAALLLLLPSGMLLGDEAAQAAETSEEVQRTKVVVQRRLDEVKKLAQTNPAMKDLKDALERLEQEPPSKLDRPDQIRHEAIKKVDKLADKLREQRSGEKYNKTSEAKKMLRRIKAPGQARTAADKLTQALAKGDLQSAQEQIKALQEQLAKLKSPEDAEQLKQMQQQLETLAKKISDAADDQALAQKLQQAGIKKEDAERMLQQLSKKDLDQLKQELQKKGMSQSEIDKLAQQLQKRQQGCQACNRMAQAMKQAADAAAKGDSGQAMANLQSAGDQLSEMEMLEQELGQIDSMLSELQDAKNDLDNPCPNCNGQGCSQCQGPGQGQNKNGPGMGQKPGHGSGGLAPEEQTATRFKRHRANVQTTEGRIVGQFLVDGQQAKGEVSSELAETVAAGEREATDLIHRDRIPRQYQNAVREYFSSMRRQVGPAQSGEEQDSQDQPEGEAGEEDADEEADAADAD